MFKPVCNKEIGSLLLSLAECELYSVFLSPFRYLALSRLNLNLQ